jgi:hypothetical protein
VYNPATTAVLVLSIASTDPLQALVEDYVGRADQLITPAPFESSVDLWLAE